MAEHKIPGTPDGFVEPTLDDFLVAPQDARPESIHIQGSETPNARLRAEQLAAEQAVATQYSDDNLA